MGGGSRVVIQRDPWIKCGSFCPIVLHYQLHVHTLEDEFSVPCLSLEQFLCPFLCLFEDKLLDHFLVLISLRSVRVCGWVVRKNLGYGVRQLLGGDGGLWGR